MIFLQRLFCIFAGLAFTASLLPILQSPAVAQVSNAPKKGKTSEAPPSNETNVTYLDDLEEVKFEVHYGSLGKHGSTAFAKTDVQKCRLDGMELEHSLSMHPAETKAAYVIYNLRGGFNVFRGKVAINSPSAEDGLPFAKQYGFNGSTNTPLKFRIIGDGKLLWESRPLDKHGESHEFEMSVVGIKELRLEALCTGKATFAWAFWANPRVSKGKALATSPVSEPEAISQNAREGAKSSSPANKPAESLARGPDVVTFAPLDLPDSITSMALTEDGRYLVVTHQAADKVSVWDVVAGKLHRTVKTPSPRCVLCRGDGVYIGHSADGTIRFFSRKKNWSLVDEFDVKKTAIVALSAPRGEYFKQQIIVTCHGGGTNIIHLDAAKDKHQIVNGKAVGTCSYDGKLILTQDSFHKSPAGTINVYAYADFLGGKPKEVLTAGEMQTPFIDQVQPGTFWFGGSMVFGGASLQRIPKTDGGLIVPDFAQRVFYWLGSTLRAQRFDGNLTEIGSRKVAWTAKPQDSSDGVYRTQDRHRSHLLDIPSAVTLDGALYLFVVNHPQSKIWMTKTVPFVVPGAMESIASTTAAKGSTDVAKPALNEWGLPARIVEGSAFKAKLTGPAGAEYELLTAPNGMKLSKSGELTWTPAKSAIGTHELKIRVNVGSETSFARPKFEVVDHDLVAKSGGSLDAADKGQRLAMDVDHYQFASSPNYRSLLLLQGDRLRVLGPDGLSVVHEKKLPQRYLQIGARHGTDGADTYVGLSKEPQQLDLIDGKTGKLRKSIPIQKSGLRVLEVVDIAVHPSRAITYVSIKHDIELPRYRILVVDEATGKIEAPADAIGTWIKVDPTGQTLYAAYRDLYPKGTRFHMNPGWNLISSPEYGNVDWLISFDLSGLKLKFKQLVPAAGGNGSGIVLSADGKRITYLSHVGTPMFSKNLAGWNPKKLKDEPVTYPTKDRASTQLLAFHPSLNLVAVPGGSSAVLFDRETGKDLDDKLLITAKGLGDATVQRLLFAPDGKSLIFVCSDTESGLYLRRVELRLNAAELTTAAKGVTIPTRDAAGATSDTTAVVKNLIKVKRDEIDALKATTGANALSAAEIGRRFLNSVVVITSDEGSGTGFVVGTHGYVLTCAHVLPEEGSVTIAYNVLINGRTKTVSLKAKPVRIDRERDLALLKISPEGQLAPVAMADASATEAGEAVTVIGNPGLGSEILKHTVTTGVISSPERELDGQKYVQTSAAVNAGNSGGPVFGAKGQIVGLVVLKANLEGTAFAVPASELRQFLNDATEAVK